MDPRPSPIPPGTLSLGVVLAAVASLLAGVTSWKHVAVIVIIAVVAIARAIIEAWKLRARCPDVVQVGPVVQAPTVVRTGPIVALLVAASLLAPSIARADGAAVVPPPRLAIVVPDAPTSTESDEARRRAAEVAAIVAGATAGLVAVQTGLQAAPVLKSWVESKAGQIVLGCIAGAIVVTSAGSVAIGVYMAAK